MASVADPPTTRTAPDEAETGKWAVQFIVICESVEQKAALKKRAREAGRSLSRYALLKAIQKDPTDDADKRRIEALSDDIKRYKEDLRERIEAYEGAQRRIRDLERQVEELHRLLAQYKISLSQTDVQFGLLDARVLQLVGNSKDALGRNVPILERQLIITLDKVTDPTFIGVLQSRLGELVDMGVICQVYEHGKPAYLWRGEA